MRRYYTKEDTIVRDSNMMDVAYIAENMKRSDVNEIWASHHKLPNQALLQGLEYSLKCLTVVKEGIPVAMFGVVPVSEEDPRGVIWMLSTDEIFDMRFEFVKKSRAFVKMFFDSYPRFSSLFNFVDARNTASIKWLKSMGACVDRAKPFGVDNMPFHHFEFLRGD